MRLFVANVFILSVFIVGNIHAQRSTIFDKLDKKEYTKGEVEITQSSDVKELTERYIEKNKQNSTVEGYRIQIYSGTGATARKDSQEARAKFSESYPEEKLKIEYNAPFWRVRVGCFRHKHEALRLLNRTKRIFPNCYIVRDSDIPISELK